MSDSPEFEMEVNCPVCQEDYSDERSPMVLNCGHTLCKDCVAQLSRVSDNIQCPTCRQASTGNPSKNYKLEDAISIIKKLREQPKVVVPPNSVQCATCLKNENEAEMWVCRNCTKDTYQYDVVSEVHIQTDLEVTSVALCGSCAIRLHVNNGHETLPFFPISSALRFQTHLEAVKMLKNDFNEHAKALQNNYASFGSVIQTSNVEIERMTDMMRKSKSSDVQQQFMESIDKELKRMSDSVIKVADLIDGEQATFSKLFAELVEKNQKDEAEKCREGVERKSESPCADCQTVTHVDKMFCCVVCSEYAAELIKETIAVEKISSFTVSDLAMCSNCVINSHTGGGQHEIVKVPELQAKYSSVIRLLIVDMKSKKMCKRFTDLLNTFGHYKNLILEYEKNISRMSNIAMEARGHPDHFQVVDDLEKTIVEAEKAVRNLQTKEEMGHVDTSSA